MSALVFALLLTFSGYAAHGSQAGIEGDYVGAFGFYRMNNLRAELRINKGGKKFEGILSFWHFKETIGAELVQSTCRSRHQKLGSYRGSRMEGIPPRFSAESASAS